MAGGTNVGEIQARITLDMAEFRRNMDEARRRISDLERDSRRGADGFRDMGSAMAGLAAGAGLSKLVSEVKQAVAEANKLFNAFQGLNAVAKGFGVQTADAQQAAQDLAKRGFLTLTEAALAYKTALSTGLGLDESTKLINSLADSAAYNRQSFYTMGGAIQASLDGIKNGNSVLSDAVGVTKNLSVMQKEYAATIGTTAGKLTDAQKIQAAYNGFIKEGVYFVGNADEAMQGFTGTQNRFTQATNEAQVAFGQAFMPSVQSLLETLTPTVLALADFVTENKELVAGLTAGTAGFLGLVAVLALVPPALALIKTGMTALAVSSGPIGLAIVAISALAGGIAALTTARAADKKAIDDMLKAQKDLNAVLDKAPVDRTAADVETLTAKHEELGKALEEEARLRERLAEIDAAGKRGEGTPQMLSEAMDINDALDDMGDKLQSLGFENVEAGTRKYEELGQALKYSLSALSDSDKAEASALATKKQTLVQMTAMAAEFKTLNAAQTLDASQKSRLVDITESLIEQYPTLNAHQGEDGRIRADNIDTIISQIATDKKYTDQAADHVATRIRNFGKENAAQAQAVQAQIDNYTRLVKAMSQVSGARAETFAESVKQAESKPAGGAPNVMDIVFNNALTSKVQQEAQTKLDAALAQQQKYSDTVREMEKLAAEVENGTQDFTKDIIAPDAPKAAKDKAGKTPAEQMAEMRKTLYQADLSTVQYTSDIYNLTADKQIEKYEALKKKHAQFLKESVEDARTLNLQLKRLGEDSVQSRYDFSATTIDNELRRMEDAGVSERELANQRLYLWQKVRDRYAKDSAQYRAADEQAYQARKDLAEATVREEEALYKSRQELAKKTKDLADDLLDAQKDAIKKAKDADLAAIETRKKAALDDYDARIDAIQKLRDANKTLNSDADYATTLGEKNARLAELASAVGPEGIAEREALLKEIERMQLEHDRELSDRTLEAQQQALSDEKAAQQQAFDEEKTRTEAQYDALTEAFDSYSGDIKTIESGIAAFRVSESATANATILTNLDAFLTSYRAKMAELATMREAADLAEYNNNKNLYAAAKASGNTAEAAALAARNQALRDLYNVGEDTGKKLQHFSGGGIVQGASGAAVPVVAHAGELILNAQQQAALFAMVAAPRVAAQAPTAPTYITNHIDLGAEEVVLTDRADIATFYDERTRAAARLQSMGIKD